MAPRIGARQSFNTNKVEKQDSLKTLFQQRTDARAELGRILIWARHQGTHVKVSALEPKLAYLLDTILRENV